MQNVWFVTGTDTDVGKTFSTGWIARQWIEQGHRTITQKLVQTGSDHGSPDIDVHRRLMQMNFPEDEAGLTAPEVFPYPCSPHMASALQNRAIDFEKILKATQVLSERYDRVIVEGAGGIMVPLTEELLTIDFVARQKWPIIFVTSGKLGSINHTLLSLEAMKNRGMELGYLIFNDWHTLPDENIDSNTYEFFTRWLSLYWPKAEIVRCPKISV